MRSHDIMRCNEPLVHFFLNRCPQSEAYERRQDPNGMYMKHLLKHVMNDTKVEDVLHQVAGGIWTCSSVDEIRVQEIKNCFIRMFCFGF